GGTGYLAVSNGAGEGVLIDDPPASAVDDSHSSFHLRQGRSPNEPARLRVQRRVYGDEVTASIQFIEAGQLNAETLCHLRGNERIECDDSHLEPQRTFSHQAADVPDANDAQRFVEHLRPDEVPLFPLAVLHGS